MADSNDISVISNPSMAWDAIKQSFSSFVHLKVGDGISELTKLGGDLFGFVVGGISAYLVYDILKNKNMQWYQKILPISLIGIGFALAVPAMIAVIIGASALVPPFMFIASVGAVYRSVSIYLEERTERNNLRKDMITKNELDEKILKLNLKGAEKKIIDDYIDKSKTLYNKIYQLRNNIISNRSISLENKKILVQEINQYIEQCSKDKNKGEIEVLNLSMDYIPVDLKQKINEEMEAINHVRINYNSSCKVARKIVPKSLLKKINAFKLTQEKIYSQDLPEPVKDSIFTTLQGDKIDRENLNLLYGQIGNQYLNITADEQIHAQDKAFNAYMLSEGVSDSQLDIIKKYYQLPRDVFTNVNKIIKTLKEDEEKNKELIKNMEDFLSNALNVSGFDYLNNWNKIKPDPNRIHPLIYQEIANISKTINVHNICAKELVGLSVKIDKDENSKLKTYIKEYGHSTSVQFSNLGLQFPSPKIDFSLQKNNLLWRAKKAVKDKIESEYRDLSEEAINKQVETMAKGKSPDEVKHLKEDFKNRFENTFNVIEKKQRLRHLEHSVPRRLGNVFLAFGLCGISLASTIIIPAVASPAAPAAAIATTVLGAITATLTCISLANSADIIRREFASKAKVVNVRNAVIKAMVPDIKSDKKKNKEYANELKKKQESQSKKEAKEAQKANKESDRRSAFLVRQWRKLAGGNKQPSTISPQSDDTKTKHSSFHDKH
jgi:hypothetical protein